MRFENRLAVLALVASVALPGCGGGKKPAEAKPETEAPKKVEAQKPTKTMPKFDKSGIVDDLKKLRARREEVKHGTREEKEKAQAELDTLLKEVEARWATKPVPDPEGYYLAMVQTEFLGKHAEAVTSLKRYLAVVPENSDNFGNAHGLLVRALLASGDLDGAEAALRTARAGPLGARPGDLQQGELALAGGLEKAGRLEAAARHFTAAFETGTADPEAAVFATDCLQRAGKPAEAVALARKALEVLKGSQSSEERMKVRVAACLLVGKEAPGFAGARYWKGTGGPVADAALQGKVTLVFGWKTEFSPGLMKGWSTRLRKLADDYEDRVQCVGVSRLQRFDPRIGQFNKDLTVEEELDFYDGYERQYNLRFPLAVGGLGETTLVDAWCASVVPSFAVVGKDGRVAYTRTGFNDDHFATVRAEIDKALAK